MLFIVGTEIDKGRRNTGYHKEKREMENVGMKIRKSLLKRQQALKKFNENKETFLLAKKRITNDIEEARAIWKTTMDQLPNLPFS